MQGAEHPSLVAADNANRHQATIPVPVARRPSRSARLIGLPPWSRILLDLTPILLVPHRLLTVQLPLVPIYEWAGSPAAHI